MNNESNATADVAVLMLSDNGLIRECNQTCESLFGYLSGELIWQHVSKLLPQLQETMLMRDGHLNPRLCYLIRIGRRFEAVGLGGIRFAGTLFINEVENLGQHCLRLVVCPEQV